MKRKKSRKLKITRTVIVPKWERNLRAAMRGLKRDVLYILAAIGGVWMIWRLALWLVASIGG